MLDAGAESPIPGKPDILAAQISDPDAHDPVEITAASALGGSSHWWGGRCVPLDPVDFRAWPIKWEEMVPWWRYAAERLGAGAILERPAPGRFAFLEQFHATTAEAWAPDPNLSRRWRKRIRSADGPQIVLGARVVALRREGGRIAAVEVATPEGPQRVAARHTVLTCGGLGGLRLLLMAQRDDPSLFGGPGGPLGRGYMGHLTGSIADIVFKDRADAAAFSFFEANGGYIVRRRIMPREETIVGKGLGNIAWWLDNPARGDSSHGSAVASARYLAARFRRLIGGDPAMQQLPPLGPHFANVGRSPLTAAAGLGHAIWTLTASRLTKQKYLPRRFHSSGGDGWRAVYHAEQKPDPANRISLGAERDSIGLSKLKIDFRFADRDLASVVRAHELLDRDLRAAGAGELRWKYGDAAHDKVADQARDGYHQLGGAVMGDDPATSIVDRQCRAHGLENLWIASASVFPSGGQANPTLTVMALACRVASCIVALNESFIASPLVLAFAG